MANFFPKSINKLPIQLVIFLGALASLVVGMVTYYGTPKYTRVGYMPIQPVPFSHEIHFGQLKISCTYCHTNVERSPHSNVPDSQTCMTCHSQIRTDSDALAPIRESYQSGKPVPWVRIHMVPDYVYFAHQVHVNRGISCGSCHGKIPLMTEIYHKKPLSMDFCLDCHRNPENYIRPLDRIYDMNYEKTVPEQERRRKGEKLVAHWEINPGQSCSVCHR